MKVLMTSDAVGGVWTYALDLARSLSRREIQVALAVMGPPPSPAQLDSAHGIDVRHADFKLEWMDDPWCDVDQAALWLRSLEAGLNPDIVHLNGYAHGAVPFAAPKLVVAHSCVLSWWEAVHGEPAPDSWNEYRRRIAAGLRSADFVAAPTRAMLESARKHYGPLPTSFVIPNGCDPNLFRSAPKDPFILTAGRLWDKAKNIETLDRAARDLPWPVLAAGEGGSPRYINAVGQLPPSDLRTQMSRAAIFAIPSRYEPFGLAILEAAFSGCALVLGDIPSLRENWNGAALFVPPDSPEALAGNLRGLIEREQVRLSLQQQARERARCFTLERMADAYAGLYDALRSRSQPAADITSGPFDRDPFGFDPIGAA